MRTKRTILFRVGAILLLLAIVGIMMIIGRRHTVYIDNESIDYSGQTYTTPYKVVVCADGEQVVELRDKGRGMATCIGQTFKMTLEITQEKGGSEEMVDATVSFPHYMDDIAISLPMHLAGLSEEAYLSEFQVAPEVAEEESESSSDKIPADGMSPDTQLKSPWYIGAEPLLVKPCSLLIQPMCTHGLYHIIWIKKL